MNRNTKWLLGSLIAVLVICALAYWIYVNDERFAQRKRSVEDARELIEQKNVGLGYLENQKLDESLAIFEKIATQVPDEPLATRNIAVARVLALGDKEEPAEQRLIELARAALEKMRAAEGEPVAYHWLALREAIAAQDFARAKTHLDALEKATPDDAAVWYAKYRVARLADARNFTPEGVAALTKAVELAPGNAWLLVEWLRMTGSQLSGELRALPREGAQRDAALGDLKVKYAKLPDQLTAARPTVAAFAPIIQAHSRADPLASLDQAIEAMRAGDLQTAATRMLMLANVLVAHAAPDQQAVRWHPLEFVLENFGPKFYAQTQSAEAVQPPAIDVRFVAADAWQAPAALQEKIGEIRDVALADFDLDGAVDIIALGAARVAVWSRPEKSEHWQELVFLEIDDFQGLVVQDLDADFDETLLATRQDAKSKPAVAKPALNGCPSADVDLILFGSAGVRLIENRFDPQTRQRTLAPVAPDKLPQGELSVLALTCADLEADGDLDLALAAEGGVHLWRNSGDWQFADMSPPAAAEITDGLRVTALDVDRDIDIDLFVAAASGGGWLENLRHGQFRWRTFEKDALSLKGARDFQPIDLDANARWDLLAATKDIAQIVPFDPKQPAAAAASSAAAHADRVLTCDYDNDGWDDCLAWSASGLQLLRGTPTGLTPINLLSDAPKDVRQAAIGDLDGDGDQDFVVLAGGKLHLLENDGGNKNHWIDVTLQAQQIKGEVHSASGRVSPYGVGSLLELKAGDRYQARVVQGQVTHFGLGQSEKADVIRVGWLNGVPQNIIQPPADLHVCEQQILNTSCPYLYAWNGERFEFVTDLLWNAPLGLQVADGVLAPWRDWEYLKISGDQLQPKDGKYILQVTAELWEADYFDHVRLIAVDHPADVAIYSNEKVGGPDIAAYKIHTVRQPRPLLAARNSAGRDLLPDLAAADGVYAKPYERKLRQGVTEDHYMELELGDFGNAEQVTLFLSGWVYPAATSINVALSQGGSIAPPVPPSLEVQDETGNWVTVMPFMGFPGGKTKTIAIEIPAASHVRIRTTMEFYWDNIFFTVDEPPVEVKTTELELLSADFHERGFSRVVRDESYGPEQFLYDEVSTMPKWPPMLGRFTRYGDVLELLMTRDDRLLVMGAGDETTLRFAAIDPPPPGWKRDFLLYSVGWDKDANLQTVLGQSSEPLPFEKMSSYPWPADEPLPASLEYQRYLNTYQTRRQTTEYRRALRRWEIQQ